MVFALILLSLLIALLVWHFRSVTRPKATDPPGVRSHVSFVGGERYLGPDEELDDQSCGRGILVRVSQGLRERGLEPGDIIDEDWGALLQIGEAKERLHVCSGYRGDDWLIFVSHRRGADHALADSALLRRLVEAIDATLKSLPGIDRVTWHRTEDWTVGREDHGTRGPLDAPGP
jgi:hypothetical protein